VLELNSLRRRRGDSPVVSYQALCRELSAAGPGCFGDLSSVAARSVLRRYSDAWFVAAKAHTAGDGSVRFPRRRRSLLPLRFYAGTFALSEKSVVLPVARGAAPLVLRLCRPVPYEASEVRSLTLVSDGARLFLEVTAEVPVEDHHLDPDKVAGVDLGIIHPYALAGPGGSLIVSGRALRAESRLHLADSKGRSRAVARRAPSKGQRGSRRWRKVRAAQARAEGKNRRRIHQAQHEAAVQAVAWAVQEGIGRLVVGDPKGITRTDAGRRQNLALRTWRRTHLLGVLLDKAERAGMTVVLVDERGTSSTCPECSAGVAKPKGRVFRCGSCGYVAHRDVVGARNIAARGGGSTSASALVTHRRAGRHLPGRTRRDPRRVRMGAPTGPWPAVARSGTSGESLVKPVAA